MKFVYKLTDGNNLVYYGSCENVDKRFSQHKCPNKGDRTSSKVLDINTLKMEVLEQYEDDEITNDGLLWRERHYFDEYDCININRPISSPEEKNQPFTKTQKERYIKNKERSRKYNREYRLKISIEKKIGGRDYYYWRYNTKLFNKIKPLFYDI